MVRWLELDRVRVRAGVRVEVTGLERITVRVVQVHYRQYTRPP